MVVTSEALKFTKINETVNKNSLVQKSGKISKFSKFQALDEKFLSCFQRTSPLKKLQKEPIESALNKLTFTTIIIFQLGLTLGKYCYY